MAATSVKAYATRAAAVLPSITTNFFFIGILISCCTEICRLPQRQAARSTRAKTARTAPLRKRQCPLRDSSGLYGTYPVYYIANLRKREEGLFGNVEILQIFKLQHRALGAGGGDLAVQAQPALLELGLRPLLRRHLWRPLLCGSAPGRLGSSPPPGLPGCGSGSP